MITLQPPKLEDVNISNGALGNVAEIVAWQNAANKAETPDEKSDLVSRIESLVGKTQHKGTVSYGLRVLSGFGYNTYTLFVLAQAYNERVDVDPSNRDSPTISGFYVELEPDKEPRVYTEVDIKQ